MKLEKAVIFIEARQFVSREGSSYFSARIYFNGDLVGSLPVQYGYESAYEYAALEWLKAHGYVKEDVPVLWRLREHGYIVHNTIYEAKQKDVRRFGVI
jgi:hypothetical protein